ncbi:MAG: GyrI-like domain-containing protein [Oscillospiraceae bacterium]|nr:GyrI-like domain-containing protein [Oscillospiraceae bacterium]
MSGIRIIEFPKCKMLSSGYCRMDEKPFAEGGKLQQFEKCWKEYDKKRTDKWFMRDFIMHGEEEQSLIWYYALPDDAVVDFDYEIIDFEGGLYASDVAILGNADDESRVYRNIKEWIKSNDLFEIDERHGHYDLSHGIQTEWLEKAMGYMQLEIYVPIKLSTV